MTMLDLPSLLPHHSGKPLFFAGESQEIDLIIDDTLKRGYFDVPKSVEVLGRPLAMYFENKKVLYFMGSDKESLLSVQISDLKGLLKNFRHPETYGTLYSQTLYEVSDDYCSFDMGTEGFRVIIAKSSVSKNSDEIQGFMSLSPDNLIESLQALSGELEQPVGLFSTTNNRIALLPHEGDWFVPLDLTEVMDFVTFFS